MIQMNIKEIVREILYEYGIDEIDGLEQFTLDSIQYISIICDIEEKFDITIPDDDLVLNSITLESLCHLVYAAIANEKS